MGRTFERGAIRWSRKRARTRDIQQRLTLYQRAIPALSGTESAHKKCWCREKIRTQRVAWQIYSLLPLTTQPSRHSVVNLSARTLTEDQQAPFKPSKRALSRAFLNKDRCIRKSDHSSKNSSGARWWLTALRSGQLTHGQHPETNGRGGGNIQTRCPGHGDFERWSQRSEVLRCRPSPQNAHQRRGTSEGIRR